jgi:hypothetical protein
VLNRLANKMATVKLLDQSDMNSPSDSPDAIRSLLPNYGERFLVRDAANAMEKFYRTERLSGYDDDSIVVVAGRFGEHRQRRFEIAFFRSFDLTTQLEVSLRFPIGPRCMFLRRFLQFCESLADVDRLFNDVRSSRWFRRFASVPPQVCSIHWRGADEMGQLFSKAMEAIGPHL